jgi:hypothetical protein
MDTSDLGQVDELKFNSHISNICKKASMKLNVLKGLGKYLNIKSCRYEELSSFIILYTSL